MSPQVPNLLLVLLTADPPVQDSNCGTLPLPLPLPLLVGLVAADALMTLLIVGAVFACARPWGTSRKPEKSRIYVNMPGRG
ncbi:hematopoietic cell signal transducer isoform X2 [Dromiciops gliroides]|uniref:hematopoietic cell signal transducer isoform X2 n=1 Tax=Dromiciops gliroides TaxID=33562 RepID=UPI001CC5FC1F|nr:hematopoietic cell signal transducer isoform X2 [Dromiciops gliroides]